MEVAWDQLNDVREPVLANRCDNIDRDLIVNILAIALIGDLSLLNSALVDRAWVGD